MKKLDYLDKLDYEKLPQSYKDTKSQFHIISRELIKLDKKKDKLKLELKSITVNRKSIKKQHTKLYKELEFINKSYLPKCYVVIDNKNSGQFLNLIIKHQSNITMYLGKKEYVIKELKPFINNLNNYNFKSKINDFMSIQIGELITTNDPNWFYLNQPTFSDILKTLNDTKDDSMMSFNERLKQLSK